MLKIYRLSLLSIILAITIACVPVNQNKIETDKQGQLIGINLEDTSAKHRQKTDDLFQMVGTTCVFLVNRTGSHYGCSNEL